MTDTLTDFVVCSRQTLDPPRETPGDLYIAAILSVQGKTTSVKGVCKKPGAVSEIVLFTARFNGKPVVGGLFVCQNETRIIECETTEYTDDPRGTSKSESKLCA